VLAPPVPAFAPAPALPAATKPAAPNAVPPTVPSVVIEKRCPETVNAGAKLTYEIIVRNLGQSAVQNTRVEEDLPAGTKFIGSDPPAEAGGDRLAWSLGQLEPGVERKLRVEVQPAADGEFKSIAVVTMSTMATMRTSVVRPKLAITLSGPEQVQAGDVIPLSIQVQNPGTGSASSVMLRVKLPAGLTHPGGSHIEAELGILPAGEVRTIPLRVTATAGGPQTAEVSATGEGGLEAAASVRAMVLQPQLLVKRNGPAKVTYKSEVTEEYELANPGNAPAANVTMTEVLPAGLEFIGASDGAVYDPVGRSVTWRLGSHAPGAVRRVVLKAKATAVGEQPTRVVANADRGLEARTDGSVSVEGIPALRLEVVDLEDPVEVGGDLVYEIRIVNQGSCACTNIRIVCDVPEGMQAIEAMGPGNFQLSGAQLAFDPLPKLAPKADVVYRVKARGQQPGDYRFKAQMTCDQLRTPVNKEESSRVYKNGE
ncbi:MAG: DUF11 domain-containing protein, partial [Gemmataceae bacterium]|nr:DUF11 domain-containing protein [Gemmataceae bacterium]